MDNLFLYLLKVSAGTILLYLGYVLFFSKDTFYLRNRIFLIMILLLPIIFPLLKISNLSLNEGMTVTGNTMNYIILSGTALGATMSERIASFNYNSFFTWIYFSVTGLILIKVLISLTRTYMIIRKGTLQESHFPKLIFSDLQHPPFSFFPYVVIPAKIYETGVYQEILDHENAHIRQGHTFDLLLSELLIAFQWFNPFIWLIKRSIILNHEYLADNISLRKAYSIKEYQYNLLNIPADLGSVQLAHNFSSLIKNRIIMINKRPTPDYAALKNILILPVVAILFVVFSFKSGSAPQKNDSREPFSNESQIKILKFIGQNTIYPAAAKISSDTGKVFVIVKIDKGGIIKECKAVTEKNRIKVPLMPEVVIVAYKPDSGQNITNNKPITSEHPLLKTECLRIANKLADIEIPEWKDKSMEFALAFNFQLK